MTNNRSLQRSILAGAFGFGAVSLLVFATVAFGERWMYTHLGLPGAYVTWTVLFIALGGAVLSSLVVVERWRFPKFYFLFGLAFFCYAAGWTFAYFVVKGPADEWVGSLAASVLMALVFAAGFRVMRSAVKVALLLFVANSIGYFLGAWIYFSLRAPAGMLLWGVIYGFFLGGGIGAVLHYAQRERA